MRLARSPSPRVLFDAALRDRRDACAPASALAPELWLRLFGTSEFAARSFSVLCGVATIVLIYQIGRAAFDQRTGLWAAWLAALSPILIVYSREARMYAWLVLVTCLCWRLLLALRHSFTLTKAVSYVFCLAALVYSHPLGLLDACGAARRRAIRRETDLRRRMAVACRPPRGGAPDLTLDRQLLRSSS